MAKKQICLCEPYDNYAGGPYVESMLEYNPECPVHSHHLYDPRQGIWVMAKRPHQMKRVEGEIEVCDTCININGEYVAWDQTWHALHQDKARQVQHQWYQPNPDSEELVPFCGDVNAKAMNFNTHEEAMAVPLCRDCGPRAIRHARKEEWDKITSQAGIHLVISGLETSTAFKFADRVKDALTHLRETLGR